MKFKKIKLTIGLVLLFIWTLIVQFVESNYGLVSGELAVAQLEDSYSGSVVSRGVIPFFQNTVYALIIIPILIILTSVKRNEEIN